MHEYLPLLAVQIREFVGYLKPKSVVPCVVTGWDSSVLDVVERLKDLLRVPTASVDKPQATVVLPVIGKDVVKSEGVGEGEGDGGEAQWCSEDGTDSEYASDVESRKSEVEVKKLDKATTGLPSMLVGSPSGSESLTLLLSPVRPSKLHSKTRACSKQTDSCQTSLELSDSVESGASLDADRRQQHVTRHRKRILRHPPDDASTSNEKRACTSTSQTSSTPPCPYTDEVIDLTLLPTSSSSTAGETFCSPPRCGCGNQDSQGSCQSWLPATPEMASTLRTIAFDDL